MAQKDPIDINLLVNDEQAIYETLSPDVEFKNSLKDFIKDKIVCSRYKNSFRLTVFSPTPIDEQRFRSAVSNWIRDEKTIFRQEVKLVLRMLIGMLIIGSLFIVFGLFLAEKDNVFSYTIIPVVGSVALGKAATIIITELPISIAKVRILNNIEKNNLIIFKHYDEQENSI